MKTKLLRKLRKLAKEAITIQCEIDKDIVRYRIFKYDNYHSTYNSKSEAISCLIRKRRDYICNELDRIKENMLNKELSKI